ncbi:hypothetical protein FHX15_006135 [Rhizobium sp. BK650]|nr:hypothetical protein [Rhizobium sp. BK650]
MTYNIKRKRVVGTANEKIERFEKTNEAAREALELERRLREAKTARLRLARLQAEEQGRQHQVRSAPVVGRKPRII